jgi:hypothetical protein
MYCVGAEPRLLPKPPIPAIYRSHWGEAIETNVQQSNDFNLVSISVGSKGESAFQRKLT